MPKRKYQTKITRINQEYENSFDEISIDEYLDKKRVERGDGVVGGRGGNAGHGRSGGKKKKWISKERKIKQKEKDLKELFEIIKKNKDINDGVFNYINILQNEIIQLKEEIK